MLGFRVRESGGVLENYKYRERLPSRVYYIYTLCFSLGETKKQERFFAR